MFDDDGYRQCFIDVIVKKWFGKFEVVQVLMFVLGGGVIDVVVEEFVIKYEVVCYCQFLFILLYLKYMFILIIYQVMCNL